MNPVSTFSLALALTGLSIANGAGAASQTAVIKTVPITTIQGQSPRLTVARGGAVLSWLQRTEDGHALQSARVHASRLGTAKIVAEGTDWFINPFDRPSVVALSKKGLVAHWLKRTSSTPYGYGIRMKFSDDDGKTWGPIVIPHRDRAPVQHGFAYLQPISSRSVRMAWLDGGQHSSNTQTISSPMALLSARVDITGRVSNQMVLDEQVCSCCQPALHQTAAGWVAAYRDRSSAEIRDIAITAMDERGIAARTQLPDEWHIKGCPLNGPTIASAHKRLAVSWFTAARDEPKVRIAYSADGGVSFGPPVDVATNTPLGQVSSVALADGSFLVGWVEFAGAQIAYHVRRMANSGNMNESHVVLRSSSLIASSQLACNEGRTYLAWEEMGRGTIQLARLSSELSPCKS